MAQVLFVLKFLSKKRRERLLEWPFPVEQKNVEEPRTDYRKEPKPHRNLGDKLYQGCSTVGPRHQRRAQGLEVVQDLVQEVNVTRYNTAILFSTSIFSWAINISSIFLASMLTALHIHCRSWALTENCPSLFFCAQLGSWHKTLTWNSCRFPLLSCKTCPWLHSV